MKHFCSLLIALACLCWFCWAGGLFLITGCSAHHGYPAKVPAAQNPPESYTGLPPDHFVMDALFKIKRSGDDFLIEPLLCPALDGQLLEGDGLFPNTVSKCGVYDRTLSMDEATRTKIVATVLKCGGNVLAVSNVRFQVENPK